MHLDAITCRQNLALAIYAWHLLYFVEDIVLRKKLVEASRHFVVLKTVKVDIYDRWIVYLKKLASKSG